MALNSIAAVSRPIQPISDNSPVEQNMTITVQFEESCDRMTPEEARGPPREPAGSHRRTVTGSQAVKANESQRFQGFVGSVKEKKEALELQRLAQQETERDLCRKKRKQALCPKLTRKRKMRRRFPQKELPRYVLPSDDPRKQPLTPIIFPEERRGHFHTPRIDWSHVSMREASVVASSRGRIYLCGQSATPGLFRLKCTRANRSSP